MLLDNLLETSGKTLIRLGFFFQDFAGEDDVIAIQVGQEVTKGEVTQPEPSFYGVGRRLNADGDIVQVHSTEYMSNSTNATEMRGGMCCGGYWYKHDNTTNQPVVNKCCGPWGYKEESTSTNELRCCGE